MKLLATILLAFSFSTATAQVEGDTLDVYFDFNKYDLHPEEKTYINDELRGRKLDELRVKLFGHCDSIGSHAYNDRLSLNRIQSVRRYLISMGIPDEMITESRGFGKRQPIAENSTEDGRAYNRRVEVILFTKEPKKITALTEQLADSTVTVGTNITLRNIHFEGGRSIFLPQSSKALMELLDAMIKFPNLEIRIEGHICCQPGANDGMDMGTGYNNLSEARARAVQEYLVTNGIQRSRLSYKGFGHSRPIYAYPEQTEEERTENRRVEIKILKK